jgi:hypothetical protein
MIQTDLVVCACVLFRRSTDEAIVNQQLVVRVSAIGGKDFFTDICGVLVLVRSAVRGVIAHLCWFRPRASCLIIPYWREKRLERKNGHLP